MSHLNVNWNKPYLTEAPYLIVVMKHVNYFLNHLKDDLRLIKQKKTVNDNQRIIMK